MSEVGGAFDALNKTSTGRKLLNTFIVLILMILVSLFLIHLYKNYYGEYSSFLWGAHVVNVKCPQPDTIIVEKIVPSKSIAISPISKIEQKNENGNNQVNQLNGKKSKVDNRKFEAKDNKGPVQQGDHNTQNNFGIQPRIMNKDEISAKLRGIPRDYLIAFTAYNGIDLEKENVRTQFVEILSGLGFKNIEDGWRTCNGCPTLIQINIELNATLRQIDIQIPNAKL